VGQKRKRNSDRYGNVIKWVGAEICAQASERLSANERAEKALFSALRRNIGCQLLIHHIY
jgi:hypothetical protein